MSKGLAFIFIALALSGCMELVPQSLVVNGVPAEEYEARAKAQKERGLLLHDFNSDVKGWFGCGDIDVQSNGEAMVATLSEARFDCVGGKLTTNDLSDNPVITIRMKIVSETFNESMTFKVRMEDAMGNETNYDEQVYVAPVNGGDYVDVVADFTGKLLSVNGDFDPENIVKLKIFFNTNGGKDFTGSVFIDEIRARPTNHP